MAQSVKSGTRPTLRAERAAATRRRILAAARRLFTGVGYGATTLTTIAHEAGVAVQTVYATFGSKAGILRTLREDLVHQPTADALYEEAVAEQDPARALELFARSIRTRWEAGADIVAIHADAAATNAALRAEVEAIIRRRRGGIARLAGSIGGDLAGGGLAGEPDRDRAAAILDALTLPEVYTALTGPGGWTPDRYEEWLAVSLRQQLITGAAARRVRKPSRQARGRRDPRAGP